MKKLKRFTCSAAWLSLFICITGLVLIDSAGAYTCSEEQLVEVIAPDETHRVLICRAATRAIAFLAPYGLHPRRTVTINVVDALIDNRGYMAYGSYDSRSDSIQLMSLAAIQTSSAEPLMYDEPFDEEHYSGAVAHEVAHAVMQHHMKVKPISPSPQEYLAHATQMAVLTDKRRNRIIARVDVGAWLPGDAISDIYMGMAPTRFAVKSYLHLTSMDDPSAFVSILLNAKWFYVYVP